MWLAFSGATTYGVGSGSEIEIDKLLGTQVVLLLHVVVQDEEDSEHLLGGEGDKVFSYWVPVDTQVAEL